MVIILQSVLDLVANYVTDIPTLPTLTDDDISDLSQAEWDKQALLVKARQAMLAVAFHECMTAGQSFRTPNSYRQTFFEEVIDRATEVSFHSLYHRRG